MDIRRVLLLILAIVASISMGACQNSGELLGRQASLLLLMLACWRLVAHCFPLRVYVCPCILSSQPDHCSCSTPYNMCPACNTALSLAGSAAAPSSSLDNSPSPTYTPSPVYTPYPTSSYTPAPSTAVPSTAPPTTAPLTSAPATTAPAPTAAPEKSALNVIIRLVGPGIWPFGTGETHSRCPRHIETGSLARQLGFSPNAEGQQWGQALEVLTSWHR